MPLPLSHDFRRTGFTLLELSIVLTVIALITAAGLSMGGSMIESARQASTNNKLDAIEQALIAYRLTYNQLPCPTDATLTEGSSNFGQEAGFAVANSPANSCVGGTPAANSSATIAAHSSTTVAEGAVPVRTLNLPDEYQVDGWGRKFGYAVWTPITGANAFITYTLDSNCGALTINNAGGNARSTAADYVLISYGPNGHGGYLKTGSRYFMGSDNADEWTNCHCNASADTGYVGTYVQHDPAQTSASDSLSVFDDIVRYKERWQMQNAYDGYLPNGPPSAGTGFLSGYTHRKLITIDNTNVISTLLNFPLLVEFNSDAQIGANIDSGGLNIRFTASDGQTLLNYERQSFSVSSSNATGVFWVKVPSISPNGSAPTTIYVYYKSASPTDGSKAPVYRDFSLAAAVF